MTDGRRAIANRKVELMTAGFSLTLQKLFRDAVQMRFEAVGLPKPTDVDGYVELAVRSSQCNVNHVGEAFLTRHGSLYFRRLTPEKSPVAIIESASAS